MRIIGLTKLDKFKKKHAGSLGALNAWVKEVQAAHWRGPQDIKERFQTASFLPNNRVIFNIKGNDYRLVVIVKYQNGIVAVDWVGTHAEYDKKIF